MLSLYFHRKFSSALDFGKPLEIRIKMGLKPDSLWLCKQQMGQGLYRTGNPERFHRIALDVGSIDK